jgi:manganese/iron transport system substrate-binding protein
MRVKKPAPNFSPIFVNAVVFILTIGFAGCGNQTVNTTVIQATRVNKILPQVVVTTSVLCDLTKQVAGDNIHLICLIPAGVEPNSYQPQAEDRQALEQANLILYQGYSLESKLIKAIKATKNSAPKIAVAQRAVPHPQKFTRNGDSFIDSHIWHNTKNGINMVQVITTSLIKLTPENTKIYRRNSQKIITELNQLHSWIKSRIASIPLQKKKLFITNQGMIYYVKAYGLSYQENLVKINIKDLQKAKVSTIFTDTNTHPNLINPIAERAHLQIFPRPLYISGLGESGSDGETYQKMMAANTRIITEGLGGTYLKFKPKIPSAE